MATVSVEDLRISEYEKVPIKSLTEDYCGKKVQVFGWVHKSRTHGKITFVELISSFKKVKVVIEDSRSFTFTTSMSVEGTVVKVDSPKDAYTFEIHAESYKVYGQAAPTFPLNKESDKSTILDAGHLALRLPERALFLRVRAELLRVIRDFYQETGYLEITPPTIVRTQVEGGSTLFTLQYTDGPAYMTQSSQLYLETVAPVAGSCYCIMPSYRAEKSRTSRHLCEYTHVEAELADISFAQLRAGIEGLVRAAISGVYRTFLKEIQAVYPGFKPVELKDEPFKTITYADAIKFLIEKKHMKTDGTPYQMMDDICDASEKFLVSEYGGGQPVFLTHFPVEHKPFYMHRVGGVTESCDLLFPGIGEIAGGSMRCHDAEMLIEGFRREGIDTAPYEWYIDMARFGPCPHGGYGIGFERLMMGIMNYKNVDEATLYPRKPSRCTP